MDEIKICASVVTYNRKALLEKQLLNVLFDQTFPVDKYYIIDNCSTDQTEQMVHQYCDTVGSRLAYCKTPENCGGAGGFCYGLQLAYKEGFDWYIMMDDDGMPYDDACFAHMMRAIGKKAYDAKQAVVLNSLVLCDEQRLSFGLGHRETVDEIKTKAVNGYIHNEVNPFNGTWISHGLIQKIGFPNGQFFIKGDETDYIRRALAAGAVVETVIASRYYHPRSSGYEKKKVFGRDMFVYVEAPWKEYYTVRNYVYSFLQQKKIGDALFHFAKRIYCCLVCNCEKQKVLRMMLKGFVDGLYGHLGATVKP